MPASEKRRLEWTWAARAAFDATLARIAQEDVFTVEHFRARAERSFALVQANAALGTPGNVNGRRVYAVPGTGHSFNYRVDPDAIVILRWYRQRKNVVP